MKENHFSSVLARHKFSAGWWRLCDWNMTAQQICAHIENYLAADVTIMDHADIYGNYQVQSQFGHALTLQSSLRDKILIVSKCGIKLMGEQFPQRQLNHYDTSAQHIIESARASIKALRTDRLDCLLIHRPDPLMDADEVAEAFQILKDSGDVLSFGVSNFAQTDFELLQSRLEVPLVTNQVELSPLALHELDKGTFTWLQQHRVVPMIWSPLAGGSIFRGDTEQKMELLRVLEQVREETEAPGIDTVVLAWILKLSSGANIVLGTGSRSRIASAVCAQQCNLTTQQWFQILKAAKGHDVP